MNPVITELEKLNIVAIIPCHRVEAEIGMVIASLPPYLTHVIFVDDASPDRTAGIVEAAAKNDPRFLLIRHKKNQGVGGAMITGFRKALELNADLVVKIDGDGQMDPVHLPKLLSPLVYKQADYTKGNRFRDFQALQKNACPAQVRQYRAGISDQGCHRLLEPVRSHQRFCGHPWEGARPAASWPGR
jgi:glycosyltransferase involved in cell wall biosynthesis